MKRQTAKLQQAQQHHVMSMNAPIRPAALIALLLLGLCSSQPVTADEETGSTWTQYSYEPYPHPYYVDDIDRYPAATPPSGTVNRHGELEYIGNGVFGAHWFVSAKGATWHFVTAGDQSKDVVLLVHGHPDTWYAFSKVMARLADRYYVIAVDTLGYGQSDKRPEIDVSYASVSASLIQLLDTMGVQSFNLITHDRGSVISDHLIATAGMNRRIQAFLRMQQSFDQPHGLPRPAHAAMATAEWQSGNVVRGIYDSQYVSVQVPEAELARLEWEFQFPGTPEAAARTFQGTSFEIEREFRVRNTIPNMTMPVVLLQGIRDPGQHAEEYYRAADLLPNGRVVLVDANHFIHTEDPDLVARLAHELFEAKNRNRPHKVSSEPVNFIYPEKD
ncbi:MAG: alpha/beta hydrolase [Acidobacteriota bacterium]